MGTVFVGGRGRGGENGKKGEERKEGREGEEGGESMYMDYPLSKCKYKLKYTTAHPSLPSCPSSTV